MLFSLNVGKVDAGVAVLLTEDMRVIEFPSILLPDGIKSGSIVDINVSRNRAKEAAKEKAFRTLQTDIWETYGRNTPKAPVLRCRNTTQTAVVLEWDPLELATAKLRSFSLYRNGEKLGNIPDPLHNTSTKISGLAIDREYTFQLELRTSSGMYKSELLHIHTHKMTELSGITVTPGVLPEELKDSLERAVTRIGGKINDTVRLDTTHFVCIEGRGREWEQAQKMNIPVVRPEWVEGCEREGRMVGVMDYYLDANPKLRQIGPGPGPGANLNRTVSQVSQGTTIQRDQPPTPSQEPRSPSEIPVRTAHAAGESSTSLPPSVEEGGEDLARSPEQRPPTDDGDEGEEDEEESERGEAHDRHATLHPQAADDGDPGDPGTPGKFEEVEL